MRTEKAAVYKSKQDGSGEIKTVDTLNLNFQPPEKTENRFLSCKPPPSMVFCYGNPRRLMRPFWRTGDPHQKKNGMFYLTKETRGQYGENPGMGPGV